jgi:hypothetical protein
MKATKPKTRREGKKYAGLSKSVNLKSRQHLLDFDYIDKLSPSEKDWLNRFVEEEVHANFNHKGPKLNKSKKQRKRIYDANNARNRDIYLKAEMSGMLEFTGSSAYSNPNKARPNKGLDAIYDKSQVKEIDPKDSDELDWKDED